MGQVASAPSSPNSVHPYAFWDQAPGVEHDLYIEGIHCSSCVWKLEKLSGKHPGLRDIRVNLTNSMAHATLLPGGKLSQLAQAIEDLGFRPHLIQGEQDSTQAQAQETRSLLMRLGVAGACAGNVMMFSIAVYAGAAAGMERFFNGLSLFVALPVLTYSAWPFYKSAWASLRSRSWVNIDVPVSFALLFGFGASTLHYVQGSEQVYYDSLCVFVFLLLSSRYLLRRVRHGVFQTSHFLDFYQGEEVLLTNGQSILVKDLRPGQCLRLGPGARVPADGRILKGEALLDTAVMTGEPLPRPIKTGGWLDAGTRLVSGEVEFEVQAAGGSTRLGTLFQRAQKNLQDRAPIVETADRVARVFITTVLMACVGLFLFWINTSIEEGLSRMLALVMVACPCALALATPLAMGLSLSQSAKKGLLIKSGNEMERLRGITHVVLDKTGTLTRGEFKIQKFLGETPEVRQAIASLEAHSDHPLAYALRQALGNEQLLEVKEFQTHRSGFKRGISGHLGTDHWEILSQPGPQSIATALEVRKNGQGVASLLLGDEIKPDARTLVEELKARGLKTTLLTGDQESGAQAVARALGLEPSQVLWGQSPEDKEDWVRGVQAHGARVLMMGDGANDAGALSTAHLGVAVRGSMEESLRSAGVYMSQDNLAGLSDLLKRSHQVMGTIRMNLIFSGFYNVVGASLAVAGLVTPLFAAVLMPLSSLTVIANTLWRIK